MDKVKVIKDGKVEIIKPRYLQNFLDKGWRISGETAEVTPVKEVFSRQVITEATAEVIEEDNSSEPEEDQSSNSTTSMGDE